jgi:ABC-2 type transport system permease protein
MRLLHRADEAQRGLPVPHAPDVVTRTIVTKALWESRRSVTGWALSIGAVGAVYASVWTTMNTPDMQRAMASYPKALMEALNYTDLSSAIGYVGAAVYGLLGALLMIVYGVGAGARAIAGDEEDGRLDLLLAHPVSRARAALERFAAIVVAMLLISVTLWLVIQAVNGPAQLGISAANSAAAGVQLALLGLAHAAIAFGVGAATGRRGLAVAVAAAVAVLGYLANGVFPQVASLRWTRDVSPWNWSVAGSPLRNGLQLGHCGLLLALIVVAVAVGTWAFSRRDVGV